MNWQHIQYFKVAAEEEHFTRASERLHITQPALSMAIQALEKELGAPLFAKEGRNVKLTPAGETFLGFVNQAVFSIETGVQTIRNDIKKVAGIINISSLPSFAKDILGDVIDAFIQCYPEVDCVIHMRSALETLYMIKENQVDIGFCSEMDFSSFDKHLYIREILRDEIVLMVSPEHPFSGRGVISVKECDNQRVVNYSKPNSFSRLVSNLLKKAGVRPVLLNIAANAGEVIQYIISESGMGFLPRSPSIPSSGLQIIKIRECTFTRGLYLATRKEEYLPNTVKVFRDFLMDAIRNDMVIDVPGRRIRLDNIDYYQKRV